MVTHFFPNFYKSPMSKTEVEYKPFSRVSVMLLDFDAPVSVEACFEVCSEAHLRNQKIFLVRIFKLPSRLQRLALRLASNLASSSEVFVLLTAQ